MHANGARFHSYNKSVFKAESGRVPGDVFWLVHRAAIS